MSTKIYSHYHKELNYDVGHLDNNAIVYSDSVHEVGYSIGHVDEQGLVYNHPKEKVGHCVGRMENDGKIYNHPNATVDHCVGHVDANGVIYNHPNLELGYEVGHVEGHLRKKAAAAFLLLLYDGSKQQQPTYEQTQQQQNSYQQQNTYQHRNNNYNTKQQRPQINVPSGGGSGIFYLIIAVAIFCLLAFGMAILMAFPGILFGILGLFGFAKMKEDPESFNVSPDMREACKSDAGATAFLWSIIPAGFGIFSVYIGGLAYGILGVIAIVAPVIIFYMAMRKNYYIKNLKKAVNGQFQMNTNNRPPQYNNTRPNNNGQYNNGQYNNGQYNNGPNNYGQPNNRQGGNNTQSANKGTNQNVIVKCRNPHCQVLCSVPAGAGDIIVTCPVCGRRFNART